MRREGCLLFKGPQGSHDSENVYARGSESNIEDTNNRGSIETNQRGLEQGSITEEMEMRKVVMSEQRDRGEDKNETTGDKGSSRSRNLGDPTVEAPRVSRAAASGECIENQEKILTSIPQLPTTEYQNISSCDQIRESRSANQDRSASPQGAAIVEPGTSKLKWIPRRARDKESEGILGQQEALNGRRTCASPILMRSKDSEVNEATNQKLSDSTFSRIGNGSATNSWKDGQVFAKKGNSYRSGDGRVRARVCLGSSGVDSCAVQSTQFTRAQATTLEPPTKKIVEEMKKLRIEEDQESTEVYVQGTTTRSNICSTEIVEDVEEQESEKSDHAATAAVLFPCDLDGDTEGNPYKQSKTDQCAGIPSIDCCWRRHFDLGKG